MYLTVNHFEKAMGVERSVAAFFVDRRLPDNNSFWQGKYLYIGFGNGYVSIPVYYDILRRIGLPVGVLLAEKHIELMEQLMDFAVQHEKKEIDTRQELDSIRALLQGRIHHAAYYEQLNEYLDQEDLNPIGPFGLEYRSLNRADVFLYILCDLPLTDDQWQQALRYWYALHPSYLIIDDVRDYGKDKEDGEDNVVVDLGGGAEGFERTFSLLQKNAATIEEINPLLANYLREYEPNLRQLVPATF